MFFFFSKTITYFFSPAGWLVTALIIALFTKNDRLRRRLTVFALVVFWLFGNPFLVNELALWWEYPVQPDIAARTDSTERVAVLLTGAMTNSLKEMPLVPQQRTVPRYLLGREADRAAQVLYLYKTGAIQKILISGGSKPVSFLPISESDEGHVVAKFLVVAGVRPVDIVLEGKSHNTHENALFSAVRLHQQFHTNQCVLVTSGWHMRRAMACFRKQGVQVTPFPSSFLSTRRSFLPGDLFVPREETFFNAYYLVRELVGYVTYRVVGYL